jgi:hypothetical protein
MSQLAARDGQPGNWEEPDFFLRRPETVRFRAESWQEPYESRGSRTDLRGTGGEIPPVYPTMQFGPICDILGYHSFSKAWFFADYLNNLQFFYIERNHNMWHSP